MTTPATDGTPDTRSGDARFVVWKGYQGRVDALREPFGVEPRYLGWNPPPRALRPVEYLAKSAQTLALLRRERPREVWLQVPPSVKLYLLAAYRRRHPEVRVVVDCHNITLEPPWIRLPGFLRLLRDAADVVLVHNEVVLERALALGFPEDRTLVLETRPAAGALPDRPVALPPHPRPWVLFPASFKADEPIAALLGAARSDPGVTWVLTGDARRAEGANAVGDLPGNVRLTGWVDAPTYKTLLTEADAVVGLTLLDDVQLSVANEAVGFGKAMVLSDTPVLRSLFPRGAVYVPPDAAALRDGVHAALADRERLERESRTLKVERVARWSRQADAVRARLGR